MDSIAVDNSSSSHIKVGTMKSLTLYSKVWAATAQDHCEQDYHPTLSCVLVRIGDFLVTITILKTIRIPRSSQMNDALVCMTPFLY